MNIHKNRTSRAGHPHPLMLIIISAASLFVGGLRSQFCTANSEGTAGRHHTSTTRLADGAFASRHLLVKTGTDTDHVTTTGAGDEPCGITDDQPAAAGDPINVHFLTGPGTKRMVTTGALGQDIGVVGTANGQVIALPNVAGTYWYVGRTKRAAAEAGDGLYYVEVETVKPEKIVVIAALTSAQLVANPLEADFNKLQADVAAIAAAMATPAKVVVI